MRVGYVTILYYRYRLVSSSTTGSTCSSVGFQEQSIHPYPYTFSTKLSIHLISTAMLLKCDSNEKVRYYTVIARKNQSPISVKNNPKSLSKNSNYIILEEYSVF